MLESDCPVIAQYGRADPRTVAFYTTPGTTQISLTSTISNDRKGENNEYKQKNFYTDHEYQERIQNAAKLIEKEHLDVLIVNSNEADYANARYFSGFWPLFERAGVAISASGDAALW